jgi:glycosyltransferase involved in cell wall biosynthesis
VFPSFYEGFGFPPLEAMARGCPVIVSNIASLPEICGEAALYVDPYDINSISKAILRVLQDKDLQSRLIKAGYKRVRKFTWARSAWQHQQVFDFIAKGMK